MLSAPGGLLDNLDMNGSIEESGAAVSEEVDGMADILNLVSDRLLCRLFSLHGLFLFLFLSLSSLLGSLLFCFLSLSSLLRLSVLFCL